MIDPTLGQLESMTKKQLIKLIVAQYEQGEKQANLAVILLSDLDEAEAKLSICETHNEQARAMIAAIMDGWDEYNT